MRQTRTEPATLRRLGVHASYRGKGAVAAITRDAIGVRALERVLGHERQEAKAPPDISNEDRTVLEGLKGRGWLAPSVVSADQGALMRLFRKRLVERRERGGLGRTRPSYLYRAIE